MEPRNLAVILGKEEGSSFNRYLAPVLGRTVVTYPILAAKHSPFVDIVSLHTDSRSLAEHVNSRGDVRIIPRSSSETSLTEELKHSIELDAGKGGYVPNLVAILFANSPCVHADFLTQAVKVLDEQPRIDSVASTMRRSEFEPSRMFRLKESGLLERVSPTYHDNLDPFFLDKRFMVVRWEVLKKISNQSDLVESLLGTTIYPMIQDEGVWDIDYAWQVPGAERWLRQNGFTDERTPYDSAAKPSITVTSLSRPSEDVMRVLIGTVPFGELDRSPLDLLERTPGISYSTNPTARRFKEEEIATYIREYDILIAGTERISKKVLANARKLKLIVRVGIGLDSVDLEEARRLGIQVSYTPEAPSPAVAELTIAHMLNLLRRLPIIDRKMRSGVWQRIQGERLANQVVGVIGTGRVGKRVIKHLQGFSPKAILVNDLQPDRDFYSLYRSEHVEKDVIYRECDIITLHVPLTSQTRDLISSRQMSMMKKHALLINTSRGGIINEDDLYTALEHGQIGGAAIDVFEEEPYSGKLIELENCLVSSHIGSMTRDCRCAMEYLAAEEAVRFAKGAQLLWQVPEEEYTNAKSHRRPL